MRLRVGLTGGIGAGKSEAGKAFAALGALVIDADVLARAAVDPQTEGLARIAQRYPQAIRPGGALDRGALAAIVFSDAAAREAVNAIVHPYVRERAAELERTAGAEQIVVHEVPLLFEAGFYRFCDANVVVEADDEERIARIVARSGLEIGEIRRRMRAQIDPFRARELADYTLVNDGSLAALGDGVRDVFHDLLTRLPTVSQARRAEGAQGSA
ncbi:MAG: dephospho-CoA kinase [Candidatus Eremiobacteraeota bacterium]|nr:dephospho-CoA kinase [Candidatus Eremiobacteraeota bacterium]